MGTPAQVKLVCNQWVQNLSSPLRFNFLQLSELLGFPGPVLLFHLSRVGHRSTHTIVLSTRHGTCFIQHRKVLEAGFIWGDLFVPWVIMVRRGRVCDFWPDCDPTNAQRDLTNRPFLFTFMVQNERKMSSSEEFT